MFKLSRYFSIVSLICIVVTAIVLSLVYRYIAVNELKQFGEQQNINLTQSFSNAIGDEFHTLITEAKDNIDLLQLEALTRLDAAVRIQTVNLPVLKVKAFDHAGRTVYSTVLSEVGKLEPNTYPGRQSAASGSVISKLGFRESLNAINSVVHNRYVVSSYLPIRHIYSGGTMGVLEIYTDVTNQWNKIEQAQVAIAATTLLTLMCLYLVLFTVIKRADNIIRDQTNERDNYLKEIERANGALNRSAEKLTEAHAKALDISSAKSRFLANMSHELRTPLNAIIGYSEMVEEELKHNTQLDLASDVEKIHKAGHHLLALINEILDLSKLEAGRMPFIPEVVDVKSMLNDVAATVTPLTKKNSNQFDLRISKPETLGTIHADVVKVRQILFNLVSNACKFTHNGKIQLTANHDWDKGMEWLTFKVSDNGIGMSKEQLNKVFEPFTQADDSTSRKFGGTGLGLSITKHFCELMGGEIHVQSEKEKGTTFTVRLPRETTAPYIPAESLQRSPDPEEIRFDHAPLTYKHLRKKISTVLVIDDDPQARDLMTRFLRSNGFYAETAADADTGLELARKLSPDIITLDVMMPGKDGWSVLRTLKETPELADIPVIMASMVDDQGLAFTLGAAEYLTKPMDWTHLAGALKKCVRTNTDISKNKEPVDSDLNVVNK